MLSILSFKQSIVIEQFFSSEFNKIVYLLLMIPRYLILIKIFWNTKMYYLKLK